MKVMSLESSKNKKLLEIFCLLTHPLKIIPTELNSCIYSCTKFFERKVEMKFVIRSIFTFVVLLSLWVTKWEGRATLQMTKFVLYYNLYLIESVEGLDLVAVLKIFTIP